MSKLYFEGPNYTADAVVVDPNDRLLLIKRGDCGEWALPGGFVDPSDPSKMATARREAKEETGVTINQPGELIYEGKVNDPRSSTTAWIETSGFLFADQIDTNVSADDDAREACWVDMYDLPPLYGSHETIVAAALQRLHHDRQQRAIQELGVKPEVDVAEEIERRIGFLADYFAHSDAHGFVLGISGGQDSLLAGILAQKAVERNRAAGIDATFHAVLLPYGQQADRADALLAIDTIKPDLVSDFDIKPSVDAFAATFPADQTISDFDKGNVKARSRMMAQYTIAAIDHALVIGTDHAAEALTGFFTKFGDGAADITPLAGLDKRQCRALLRALDVPEIFTTKAPTADLLDQAPGQSDEHELGLSYDTIDDYLEGKPIDATSTIAIERRYRATAHKRQLPVRPVWL